MAQTELNFQNILVIDFGQLGDIVLSLPALSAIRLRFPAARITLMLGKPGADIVELANAADEYILVDRVALRDGPKAAAMKKIFGLVRDVRRRRFDFVIDLHSLAETNLLGYLSGAKWRLYQNRENRSLDWLSRFPERPPSEDKSKHHAERYLDVLAPLGIASRVEEFRLELPDVLAAESEELLASLGVGNESLVGLFLGAGHPTRRWGIEKFAKLAGRLAAEDVRVMILLGPEESDLRPGLEELFPPSAIVVDELRLLSFFGLLSKLDVFVGGDTGPMHLAAIAGSRVVLLSEKGALNIFRPLTSRLTVLNNHKVADLPVSEVEKAVRSGLSATAGSVPSP